MEANDFITLVISSLALLVSGLVYWESNYVFKLDTVLGKHAKLGLIGTDGKIYPLIMANVTFINNGGKTDSIEDTKLLVEINGNGVATYEHEFITAREFTDIYNNNAQSTEILPIIVNGKSNTLKRYGFQAIPKINQEMIPVKFNVKLTLYVKLHGRWIKQKQYQCKNISNVWQNLNPVGAFEEKIISLVEVN
ncbi:hypothetical protein [Flavobacterium denitrificans]|uniref:hypothetical protein n=1 Tax=Flavobacterium denitrificans TaxID=281361 RepID=UPI00040C9A8D|nr:hypothetical protein [Flavobacterium denitrificans]